MATVTVSRSTVTAQEVITALSGQIGGRFRCTPGMRMTPAHRVVPSDDNTVLVRANWFEGANIQIESGAGSTEIHIHPGGVSSARLINRLATVRKVQGILEQAPEFGGPR